MHSKILNGDTSTRIVLDRKLFSNNTNVFWGSQKINHLNVKNKNTYSVNMDLAVTDPDGYSLVEFLAYLMIDLLDGSGDDTSLFEVVS